MPKEKSQGILLFFTTNYDQDFFELYGIIRQSVYYQNISLIVSVSCWLNWVIKTAIKELKYVFVVIHFWAIDEKRDQTLERTKRRRQQIFTYISPDCSI